MAFLSTEQTMEGAARQQRSVNKTNKRSATAEDLAICDEYYSSFWRCTASLSSGDEATMKDTPTKKSNKRALGRELDLFHDTQYRFTEDKLVYYL